MGFNEYSLVVSCEHAGNQVPRYAASLFVDRKWLLATHRGYDKGALKLAREISHRFTSRLFFSTITRLVADLNRSPENPDMFSKFSRNAGPKVLDQIIKHHEKYRREVLEHLESRISKKEKILHISVHSFTPKLSNEIRNADIGLLYDPTSRGEKKFAETWKRELLAVDSRLKIRMNYPYKGTDDNLQLCLRRRLPKSAYIGIELEINQKFMKPLKVQRRIFSDVLSSLTTVLG